MTNPPLGYDQGYNDGESSMAADYQNALSEHGGFPDDFDFAPSSVAREVARLRAELAELAAFKAMVEKQVSEQGEYPG